MFKSAYIKAAERKARKETKLARIEAAEKTAANAYAEATRVEAEKKRDQADAIAAYIEAAKTKDELRGLIKKLKKEVKIAERDVMRRRVHKEKLAALKEVARMKAHVVADAFDRAKRVKEEKHHHGLRRGLQSRQPLVGALELARAKPGGRRARYDVNDTSMYSNDSDTLDGYRYAPRPYSRR